MTLHPAADAAKTAGVLAVLLGGGAALIALGEWLRRGLDRDLCEFANLTHQE